MRKTLPIAALAVLLAACGKPADAPPPAAAAAPAPPPDATSSAPCYNAGFLHTGTVLDHEMTVTGDGATPPRRIVSTVTGPKDFNGARRIETEVLFYGDDGRPAATNRSYTDEADGRMRSHGMTGSNGVQQVFEPPLQRPMAMQPGESFKNEFKSRATQPGGKVQETDTSATLTYVGRERFEGPLGAVQACKFIQRDENRFAGQTQRIERQDWVAAEGPYRGFTLRVAVTTEVGGMRISQRMDATKVHRFDIQ